MVSKILRNPRFFHRANLAEKLTKKIMAVSPGSPSDSGLFLSAPRRTGKSTFIREDLRPALENAGAIVIYSDLWEDRQADPGKVIISAIRSELAKHDGVIKRIAKNAGMDKVNVGGISFSIDQVGLNQDVSISAALTALSDEIKKPITLIVDEAQHAITTHHGNDTLFALKAARDEVNSSQHHGLHIIATGSSQAKLAMLRNSKDQAFFGAYIFQFPHLDRHYVDWFCKNLEFGEHLDPDEVMTLFEKASFRPEILGSAAKRLQFDLELKNEDVAERFSAEVAAEIQLLDDQLLRVIHSLTPIQHAILKVMADSGDRYAPFESGTIDKYKAVLRNMKSDRASKVDVTTVQQALLALQDKSLVWKESRGVYALEDASIIDLLAYSTPNGTVIPRTPGH
jgi:hypothetical protein